MTIHNCLHIDKNSKAINRFTYDDETGPVPAFLTANGEQVVVDYEGPFEPGCTYNGTIVVVPEPAPAPVEQITRVTSAQAKLALYDAGLLDSVKAAVGNDTGAQIFFESAPYWEITHPYIQSLAKPLGLTQDSLNLLFTSASKL